MHYSETCFQLWTLVTLLFAILHWKVFYTWYCVRDENKGCISQCYTYSLQKLQQEALDFWQYRAMLNVFIKIQPCIGSRACATPPRFTFRWVPFFSRKGILVMLVSGFHFMLCSDIVSKKPLSVTSPTNLALCIQISVWDSSFFSHFPDQQVECFVHDISIYQ